MTRLFTSAFLSNFNLARFCTAETENRPEDSHQIDDTTEKSTLQAEIEADLSLFVRSEKTIKPLRKCVQARRRKSRLRSDF
jgi:hypothetical protein